MKWRDDPPRQALAPMLAMTEAAAAQSPDNSAIWVGLAQSALTLRAEDAVIAPVLEAVARMPESAALHGAAARLLYALDRLDDAREQVDAALGIDPQERGARLLDFILLVKASRWDEAAQRIADVRTINPLEPQLLEAGWRAAGDDDALRAVLAEAEAMLAARPGHANASYFRAYLLALLGRDDEARAAMPIGELVEVIDLPTPEGFADGETFRAALRDEIVTNPTLVWNSPTKSTRGGARTRQLRQPGASATEALVAQIQAAITAYAAKPALARTRPEAARLDIWANILGGDGYLMSHRHISGWVSGAYYVSAPAMSDGSCSGPLLFGALDPKRDRIVPPWEVLRIEPRPGRLVLFPSYAPHATEPAGTEGERISVGFDAIPC